MRTIRTVILHHAASPWGDRSLFEPQHEAKGWRGLAYHFLILNGWRRSDVYVPAEDGLIEIGRALPTVGTHDAGQNLDSVGVCLVGHHRVTFRQLSGLHGLVQGLRARLSFDYVDKAFRDHPVTIEGHFENEPPGSGTACPGDRLRPHMDELRAWLDRPTPQRLGPGTWLADVLRP